METTASAATYSHCHCITAALPPHFSVDTIGLSQSRWGWLSRPPFAAAPHGSCPLMVGRLVGRFWVRRFLLQATRQATKPKMAMDISAGLPNIGRRLSPLSSRRARRTTGHQHRRDSSSIFQRVRQERESCQPVDDVVPSSFGRPDSKEWQAWYYRLLCHECFWGKVAAAVHSGQQG